MKKGIHFILLTVFMAVLMACSQETENIVSFEDPQLAEAIRVALSIDGDISEEEVSELTDLDASGFGISTLDGIEVLIKLQDLNLNDNNIADFTPLLEVESLESVSIRDNPVAFDEGSEALTVVQALENTGVYVNYNEQPLVLDPTGPPSEGVFYKVEHENSTVYLFGSIHVGMEEIYPLHEDIEAAFDEANYLALEIDMTELNELEMGQYMSSQGMFMDGTTLRDVVSEDVFERSLAIVDPYGFSEDVLNMFKPWFVETLISTLAVEEVGYTADYGIDNYFMDRAEGELEIIGLETFESQIDIFNLLSMDSQVELLEYMLDGYENTEADMEELMRVWRTGDVATLSEHRVIDESASEDYQAYQRALMDDRDLEMTNKIEDFLLSDNGETYFVVVGALHLAGDTSIVGLLDDRGYDVQAGIQ